jgi:membrane-bound lytic murein transglycosylase D
LAAKLAEVPLSDFKALNPSLSKPVIMAAGTPQILLPWDNADIFERNLLGFSGGRLASWTVWIAPTTMKVADAAKRTGMSESQLREVNNIPPRMLIKLGSALLVPRSAHSEKDVTEKVADNGQMSLAPEVVLVKKTVKAVKGDTVASLAKRYRTTPANIVQWNKVSASANFKAGQQVVLFVPAKARAKGVNGAKKPKGAVQPKAKPKTVANAASKKKAG